MLWEPLAVEKCASGLLTLQDLLPRTSELGLGDTRMLACAICPAHSLCLPNLLPPLLQIAPSSLWYRISRDQFLRVQNNLKKHSFLFHWAHSPGQPRTPQLGQPSHLASCPAALKRPHYALVPPAKTSTGCMVSAPSINPLCNGSP